MIKVVLLYIFAVALLAAASGYLTLRINGTHVRFYLHPWMFPHISQRPKSVRVSREKLNLDGSSSGTRVWLYTRYGTRFFDIVLDRRENLNIENGGA